MVSLAPKNTISFSRKAMASIARIIPEITDAARAELATFFASSSFFFPRRRDMVLPAPIPRVKPTACIIAIIEKTIPIAPEAAVPSFATK